MRIITYNLNGIRAAINKNLLTWLPTANADIVCFQEVKASPEQIDLDSFRQLGYEYVEWFAAEKKGYSGVATFSKTKPKIASFGMQNPLTDSEGRVLLTKFDQFTLINVYMPSGTTGDERQNFKYQWLDNFLLYIEEIRKQDQHLIICGDFNICHQDIDIHNPVSNKKSSGFLPEEREWLSKFLNTGYTDCFRYLYPTKIAYTWWTYRAGAREKNLGWRIDYFVVSDTLNTQLKDCTILSEATHSDHCPVQIEIF
jgi:exodeoxyribonuclease-3